MVLCLIASGRPMEEPGRANEEDGSPLRAVTRGTAQFSSELYHAIAEEKKGENLVSSPLSAAIVLAMAGYGAGGETGRQMRSVLRLPEEDRTGESGFQSLIDLLNNANGVELSAANKIYVQDGLAVKPNYKELVATYFRSASESVNFAEADAAADRINAWVAGNTRNCIPRLVDAGSVKDAVMLLLNAIYFKGQWKTKFDPTGTADLPFHVNGDVVKNVSTMSRHDDMYYGYLRDLDAKFVELPYKGDELSMVIILPNKVDGLEALENKIREVNLKEILAVRHVRDVVLRLPKFKINSEILLNGALAKIGMGDMFTDEANFTGITDKPVKVSKVLQKAYIEVNEEGTEAAAVTGLFIVVASASVVTPPLTFYVDRPFVFAILHKDISAPLFIGKITDPKV